MNLRRARPAVVLTATASAVLLATFSRGFSMGRPNLHRPAPRPAATVSGVQDSADRVTDRVAIRLPFRASQPRVRLRPPRRGGPPRPGETVGAMGELDQAPDPHLR